MPASSTSPTSQLPGTPPTWSRSPSDINVLAEYPIATVKESANPEVGEAFIEFLTGSDGQAIMAEYGFGTP